MPQKNVCLQSLVKQIAVYSFRDQAAVADPGESCSDDEGQGGGPQFCEECCAE